MQSILRWSIENSTPLDSAPSDRPPAERKDLDPGIIDLILGKPDAEQMKEDIAAAIDTSRTEDERIAALDHLEMLIEHIDNANDMEKLKLWEPLQSLLTSEKSTPDIQTQAIWVIGTALQNNPSAQDVYLSKNPLPVLLSFLDPSSSTSAGTRAKALYALSGLLKHNAPAVQALDAVDGWTKIANSLQDPSIAVRRKAVFLLSTLLIPSNDQPPAPSTPSATQSATPTSTATAATPSAAPLLLGAPSTGSTAVISAPSTTSSSSSSSTSTAITSAPTSTTTSITSAPTSAPNILTPDTAANSSSSEPIHDNSHAAHLKNPSRSATSPFAIAALQRHGLLDAVVGALVAPVPYGPDGDNVDPDVDFEEKGVHLLYTYAVTCRAPLSPVQKTAIRGWIQAQKSSSGGEAALLERWDLSRQSYAALVGKLV